jgi:hypothetical protein
MNPGIKAINALALMGYRPLWEGQDILLKWHGPGDPDPGQVRPFFEAVKANNRPNPGLSPPMPELQQAGQAPAPTGAHPVLCRVSMVCRKSVDALPRASSLV